MAKNNRGGHRHGLMEAGDIYTQAPNGRRGAYVGRLTVDLDNHYFYQKSEERGAKRISQDSVMWMISHDLIDFDHEDTRDFLVDYAMRVRQQEQEEHRRELEDVARTRQLEIMDADRKLVRKTKRAARIAKFTWLVGCATLMASAVLISIPAPDLAPAIESSAGEGVVYPADPTLLDDATYLSALGNSSNLYGLIFDNKIVEVGEASNGLIEENVALNADVSSKYPLHMRPLLYERGTFYQTMVQVNDSDAGKTGVYLQNKLGKALGVEQNELVMCTGTGLSSMVISAPDKYAEKSAEETQQAIQQRQEELMRMTSDVDFQEEYKATLLDGWLGYDSADIDANRIAASYWYTKGNSGKVEDLRRKIVVWNYENGMENRTSVLFNFQDEDNSFYDPVISMSPSSGGAVYWIGYMKENVNGDRGFYIRKYTDNESIMQENLSNTFSTRDLTGSDMPITNYTIRGDKLFFEQSGYIWVTDLSLLKGDNVAGTYSARISRAAPNLICNSKEIRAYATRDEQHKYGDSKITSHYQVVTRTNGKGKVEYGIAYIEADGGNLVYQPIRGTSVEVTAINGGAGTNTGSTTAVSSGDEAAVQQQLNANQAANEARNKEKDLNVEQALNERLNLSTGPDTSGTLSIGADQVGSAPQQAQQTQQAQQPEQAQQPAEQAQPDQQAQQAQPEQQAQPDPQLNPTADATSEAMEGAIELINAQGPSRSMEPAMVQMTHVEYGEAAEDEVDEEEAGAPDEEETQQQSGLDSTDGIEAGTANSADNGNSQPSNTFDNAASSNDSEDTTTEMDKILIRAGDANGVRIICFAIRGEQFYWIEDPDDTQQKDRVVRVSPIYYKNDAMRKAGAALTAEESAMAAGKHLGDGSLSLDEIENGQEGGSDE